MLHVCHVAAEAVLVVERWIPIWWFLVDVVGLNSFETKRVAMIIASVTIVHHRDR